MLEKLKESLAPKIQTSLYVPRETLHRLDQVVDVVRDQGNGKATRNMLMTLLLEEGLDTLQRELEEQNNIPDLEVPNSCGRPSVESMQQLQIDCNKDRLVANG